MSMTTLLKRNPMNKPPKPTGASPLAKKKEDDEKDRAIEDIKEDEVAVYEEKREEEKKDDKGKWKNQRVRRSNLGEDIKSQEEMRKRLEDEAKQKREEGLTQLQSAFDDKQPEALRVFKSPVWNSFSLFQNYFRQVNIAVPQFQVCVISRPNRERFDLVEAIIGFQIFHKIDFQTTRLIRVQLLHNREVEEPQIRMGSEGEDFQEYSRDMLEEEIDKKDNVFYIQIISKYVLNIELILLAYTDGPMQQKFVLEHAKKPEMFILWVEAELGTDRNPDNFKKIEFLQKLDPTFSRLAFVHANFRKNLVTFPLKEIVDEYLSSVVTQGTSAKNFFVSLVEEPLASRAAYIKQLEELQKGDFALLKSLNYSLRYTNYIGIFSFRRYFFETVWTFYKSLIPKLMEQFRINKYKHEVGLVELDNNMLKTIDLNRLKKEGSDYLGVTLKEISALVSGSVDGSPRIFGQTLEEEIDDGEIEDWVDAQGRYLPVNAKEWQIPHIDSSLYGGQQFERLVMEFHAVASHINPSNASLLELSNAYSPRMNVIWAATDIAQKKIRECFEPLIRTLTKRAEYILNRLLDLQRQNSSKYQEEGVPSHQSMTTVQSTLSPLVKFYNVDEHPFFIRKVTQLYYEFNQQNGVSCLEDCFDEFYSTETIYWELINFSMDSLEAELKTLGNGSDPLDSVKHLTKVIFFKIRRRIIENVIVKLYNHMLVPLKTGAWSGLHKQLSVLTEGQLEEMFELAAVRREMETRRYQLKEQQMNLQVWQFLLENCARVFTTSHSPQRW